MPILWLVRQIRWFPYIAPSVVERLQATLSMPLNDRGISDYIFIDSECWLFLVKTIIFHWLRVDIGRVMITVLIWKMSCINLFITYFNIELKRTKLTSHTHQTMSDWYRLRDDNNPDMEKCMHCSIYKGSCYHVIRVLPHGLISLWHFRCLRMGKIDVITYKYVINHSS